MGLSSNNNKQVVMMVRSSGTDGHDLVPRQGTKRQHLTSHQHHVAQSEALKCPRCESPNTKFCYYNNYNKSQPRHFCRSCKRHWTKGGTLRNVPVGGVRKNKRPKTKSSSDHRHVALNPNTNTNTNDGHHHQYHQLITNPINNDGDDHDGKSASEILFQAMMMTGPPGPIYFSAASSPFESSTSLSSSVSNHNAAEDHHHHHNNQANDIVVSKSSNNVVVNSSIVGSDQPPWKQLVSSTNNNNYNNEGFGNYSWNFEDIDSLVSADHVHLPWESHYSLLDILKP